MFDDVLSLWKEVDPTIRAKALLMGGIALAYIAVLARRQFEYRRTPQLEPAMLEIVRWERKLMLLLAAIVVAGPCFGVLAVSEPPDAVLWVGLGAIGLLGILAARASWMVGRLRRRAGLGSF